MIDFTKPVQTRQGWPVQILCTHWNSVEGPKVIGLINVPYDCDELVVWEKSGCCAGAPMDHPYDLVQTPPPKRKETRIMCLTEATSIILRRGTTLAQAREIIERHNKKASAQSFKIIGFKEVTIEEGENM